jgi:hypothetical protein
MTSEERMIRVTREEWRELVGWLNEVAEFLSDSELDGTPAHAPLWLQELEGVDSSELELAPPKDWKPFCYELTWCKDKEDDAVVWGDECLDCPHRKRD